MLRKVTYKYSTEYITSILA